MRPKLTKPSVNWNTSSRSRTSNSLTSGKLWPKLTSSNAQRKFLCEYLVYIWPHNVALYSLQETDKKWIGAPLNAIKYHETIAKKILPENNIKRNQHTRDNSSLPKREILWFRHTVNFLNIRTPQNYCNYPKIWTIWLYHRVMSAKDADRIANTVDPDQTAHRSSCEQSDLGQHCLPRPVCPKT